MSLAATLSILFAAALLEAGGDALLRKGMQATAAPQKWIFALLGAATLALYGTVVNLPPWNFGRLLGVYVVLFFLVSQGLNLVVFSASPTPAIWIGGSLIVAGGAVIALAS